MVTTNSNETTQKKDAVRLTRARSGLIGSNVEPIKRASLSAQVSKVIVAGLLEGRLRPGDRLIENDLVDLLGVSRSPVREALTELAQSGVVVREPGRGGRIREWTKKDLEDLFGVRSELEGYAARLAAGRVTDAFRSKVEKVIAAMRKASRKEDYMAMIDLDMAFHEAIWTLSDNLLLQQVLVGLSHQFRLFLTLNWKFHGGLNEVADNHQDLFDSITSGDPMIAERAIYDHVVVSKMIAALQKAEQ